MAIVRAAAAILVAACLACHRPSSPVAAFWFDDVALALPRAVAERLGGPLTDPEIESIKRISRSEVERAFADLRVIISDGRQGFWHVAVMQDVPRRTRHPLPSSGESMPLGMLGGSGSVGAVFITLAAIRYAPPAASRQTIVEGIGHGIGRVAVHEFGHQILGPAAAHNNADENCYENGNSDRQAQYYGEVGWTTWRSPLEQKLGTWNRVRSDATHETRSVFGLYVGVPACRPPSIWRALSRPSTRDSAQHTTPASRRGRKPRPRTWASD